MKTRTDMRLGRERDTTLIAHSFGLTVADGFVFIPYCTCGNWIGGYFSQGTPQEKVEAVREAWRLHLLVKNI